MRTLPLHRSILDPLVPERVSFSLNLTSLRIPARFFGKLIAHSVENIGQGMNRAISYVVSAPSDTDPAVFIVPFLPYCLGNVSRDVQDLVAIALVRVGQEYGNHPVHSTTGDVPIARIEGGSRRAPFPQLLDRLLFFKGDSLFFFLIDHCLFPFRGLKAWFA